MKKLMIGVLVTAAVASMTGCTTATKRYAEGEVREVVAGFSEADIQDTVSRACQSICSQDCIKSHTGSNRAIVIVEIVTNDTNSRGRDAGALADVLGQSLREKLTDGGKIVVYNQEAVLGAAVKVVPQYRLKGRLTERNLRQDNGDYQREYNLNLTLIELTTGLERWQKRIHVGKLIDEDNVMN